MKEWGCVKVTPRPMRCTLPCLSLYPPECLFPIVGFIRGIPLTLTLFGMNAPKVRKIKGEIVQVSPLENVEVTLITVQDADNDLHTFSTSNKYWKSVGRFFTVGSIVAVEVEERIAGKTEYKDASGNVATHTSDGLNLSKISAYSSSAWLREQFQASRQSDMEVLTSVEESRVAAFASYLAATAVR